MTTKDDGNMGCITANQEDINSASVSLIAVGLFQCAEKIFKDDRQFPESGKTFVQDQAQSL